MNRVRIDLDHAATSWPKPPEVLAAMTEWFTQCGVSPDRGESDLHRPVADRVHATRAAIAARCGAGFDAAHVAFTSGATESLNLFLRAFLRPGDRVLTTTVDHSAMLRPLHALRSTIGIEMDVLPVHPVEGIDLAQLQQAIAERPTRLLATTHASNVNGVVLDVDAAFRIAAEHGVTTLLDASQSVGALPITVGADAVVASTHKSLLGPPGCGFLAVRASLDQPDLLRSPKQGGTGSARATLHHPTVWPAAFEAGTPNTPAIFGLHAALQASDPATAAARLERATLTCNALLAALQESRVAVQFVPSPRTAPGQSMQIPAHVCLPMFAFVVADQHPMETAALLGLQGIISRAGHHCAPLAHAAFVQAASGLQPSDFADGSVRLSPGPELTADAIDRACAALRSL